MKNKIYYKLHYYLLYSIKIGKFNNNLEVYTNDFHFLKYYITNNNFYVGQIEYNKNLTLKFIEKHINWNWSFVDISCNRTLII